MDAGPSASSRIRVSASLCALLATLLMSSLPEPFDEVPIACPRGAHWTTDAIPDRNWSPEGGGECVCDAARSHQVVGFGMLVARAQYVQVGNLQYGSRCVPYADVLKRLCPRGLEPFVRVHNGHISPQELRHGTPDPEYAPSPRGPDWSDADTTFASVDDLGVEMIEIRCVDEHFRPHGTRITWDAEGAVKVIGRYGPRGPVGEWRNYMSFGRVQRIENYKDGRRHRLTSTYEWDGAIEMPTWCYDSGQLLEPGAPCPR